MTRRLLVGYVTITLVVAASLAIPFGIVFAQRQRERFATALERDAVVLAAIYEDALQGHVPVDPRPAAEYATSTGARVVVVDATGTSVVDSAGGSPRSFASRPEVAAALGGGRASGSRRSETLDTDLFFVAVPIASGGTIHGAVRLTLPTREVEAKVHRIWLSLAAIVLVAVGATVTVAVTVARSITRPVAQLRDAAHTLAAGDLSARTDSGDGPPELRELAEAFNDMAERLSRLIDAQRAFVADASHQLRTPLTALRLRLENLETSLAPEDVASVEDAIVEAERLARLVDQLLELSRGESATMETTVVDLRAVAENRVRLWEPVAAEWGRRLELELPPGDLRVRAVPGGVEQILDNLLDNALRHTPEGTTVRLAVRSEGRRHVIHVVDSGPGMPPEERRRAFDRFWRGSADRSGSGLGLAIVRHLAERSGGSVEALAADGGGLDVVVSLPAVVGAEQR